MITQEQANVITVKAHLETLETVTTGLCKAGQWARCCNFFQYLLLGVISKTLKSLQMGIFVLFFIES